MREYFQKENEKIDLICLINATLIRTTKFRICELYALTKMQIHKYIYININNLCKVCKI